MTNKSNLDVAYEVVSGKTEPIAFADLWKEVSSIQGFLPEEKEGRIGKFYTNLLLDGRFVNLGDNVWDLRERNTFDKVHIDMAECYTEDEEEDLDPEEIQEEKEAGEIVPSVDPEADSSNDEDDKANQYEPEEEI